MVAIQDKDDRLRRIENYCLTIQSETTEIVRAEVKDHRHRAIRFLDCREAIGTKALLTILDATSRVQLGVLARELVASRRTEIEPVLLVLPPNRVTAAVVVWSAGDLERAVGLGLVAAENTLLAPAVEAIGVKAHFLDLADRDLEALVVGAKSPHLAILVVGTDVVPIARHGNSASETGLRAQVRPCITLVVVDRIVLLQYTTGVGIDVAILTTDPQIVVRSVLTVVVYTALEVDLGRAPHLDEVFGKDLLDPSK